MTSPAANIHHVAFGIAFGKQPFAFLNVSAERRTGNPANRPAFTALREYKKPITVTHCVAGINPFNAVHVTPCCDGSMWAFGTVPVNCNETSRALTKCCSAGFVKGLAA